MSKNGINCVFQGAEFMFKPAEILLTCVGNTAIIFMYVPARRASPAPDGDHFHRQDAVPLPVRSGADQDRQISIKKTQRNFCSLFALDLCIKEGARTPREKIACHSTAWCMSIYI